MALNATSEMLVQLGAEFSWPHAFAVLKPMLLFLAGVVLYSIFVFKFYKFIARKNIFEIDMNQYMYSKHPFLKSVFATIAYALKYLLFFPIFTFFWFAILTVLLSFLAKNQPVENILLVAITVVGSIRVTAYYNEDLSNDLAKMLPFALLGVFLVDIRYFSFADSITALKTIPSHFNILLYYLIFVLLLEFVLRILHGLRGRKDPIPASDSE